MVKYNGAPARSRTADLLITNQLLYQLSYKGMSRFINDKSYFAILNKSLCSQLLLQLLSNSVVKLPRVKDYQKLINIF